MERGCRNPDCTLPEGGLCARRGEFEDPLQQCPDLIGMTSSDEPPVAIRKRTSGPAPATAHDRSNEAPWSGRHLSESEADRLMYSSPARVFGIAGPSSAGKTCLITSLFLQLADGQCARLGYRFASSRTLFALQTLCSELAAWDGHSEGEMASKTPKLEAAEVGSFIHLGLRPRLAGDDRHIEVLLGDVAGEHFSELTSHADAAALQRMAFLRRCEGFVLVVDAIALHGPKGPRLDAELARMAGRLIDVLGENVRRDVPIAVILSKTDAVPELPRDAVALREHLQRRAPRLTTALRRATSEQIPHELFAVAAIPQTGQPFGVQECFGYLLGHADRRARWPRWIPPIPEAPVSSFLAMRAWRDAP